MKKSWTRKNNIRQIVPFSHVSDADIFKDIWFKIKDDPMMDALEFKKVLIGLSFIEDEEDDDPRKEKVFLDSLRTKVLVHHETDLIMNQGNWARKDESFWMRYWVIVESLCLMQDIKADIDRVSRSQVETRGYLIATYVNIMSGLKRLLPKLPPKKDKRRKHPLVDVTKEEEKRFSDREIDADRLKRMSKTLMENIEREK